MVTFYLMTIGIYQANWNFKDDTVGGNPSDWSISESSECPISIVDVWGGNKQLVKFGDSSGLGTARLYQEGFSEDYGTIEFKPNFRGYA